MENLSVSKDSYLLFMEKYKNVHKEMMHQIKCCEGQILDLLNEKGGFHADESSKRIENEIEIWDRVKLPYMQEGFDRMENCIESYLSSMQAADTL